MRGTWGRGVLVGLAVALVRTVQAGASGGAVGGDSAFSEAVLEADVIFVGTASESWSWEFAGGRMIFTDVRFSDVDLVHVGPDAVLEHQDVITLTHAGGSTETQSISVSGTPRFDLGVRYLVLAHLDGERRANPVVGGRHGMFPLERDAVEDRWYPRTIGRHGLERLHPTLEVTHPISEVNRGVPIYLPEPSFRIETLVPNGDVMGAQARRSPRPDGILDLDGAILEIERILAAGPPIDEPRPAVVDHASRPPQRMDVDRGSSPVDPKDDPRSWHRPSGPTQVPIRDRPVPRVGRLSSPQPAEAPADSRPGSALRGGGDPLCICHWFDLPIVMEQVPADWWSWDFNNDAMWTFNQYMDIFRYVDSDATWGQNDENEFGGWPSNADLFEQWGFSWGDFIAMCVYAHGAGCSEMREADVIFNPAYGWTTDFLWANQNPGDIIHYQPVLAHELGHAWGMQTETGGSDGCDETYAYDRLSVMHRYYWGIIEDGLGIHNGDAWGIRLNYEDQTAVIPITDVGVESYAASWGIINGSLDATSYRPGDPITVRNITIENTSSSALPGVRVRMFLSTNRTISESDHQVGTYWYFSQPMPRESEWSGDLSAQIPNVPAGVYHVGFIVTTGEDAWASDDFPWNDATYMSSSIEVLPPSPPSNDECVAALLLPFDGSFQVSNVGATTSGPSLPTWCGGAQIHDDVWYRFDAAYDGSAIVSFCDGGVEEIDFRMAVHEGGCSGPVVACNDDSCGLSPEVEFAITCGTTYFVRIGAYSAGSEGGGQFRLETEGVCGSTCPADLDGDGIVSGADLGLWLNDAGTDCPSTGPCVADLDQDGEIRGSDLGLLLAAWGQCQE